MIIAIVHNIFVVFEQKTPKFLLFKEKYAPKENQNKHGVPKPAKGIDHDIHKHTNNNIIRNIFKYRNP